MSPIFICCVSCTFVAIDGDDITDVEWCKKQILTTKFWPDDNDRQWKKDLSMSDYQILLVSQFTLYAKVYKVLLDLDTIHFAITSRYK